MSISGTSQDVARPGHRNSVVSDSSNSLFLYALFLDYAKISIWIQVKMVKSYEKGNLNFQVFLKTWKN